MKLLLALAAALAALAGVAGAQAHVAARPHVTVLTHAHSFTVGGAAALHAGYVDFTVRNVSRVPHGAAVIRLDKPGLTAAQAAKIIGKDPIPAKLPFTLYGGVPSLGPGQSWHATLQLTAGRYALVDDGSGGKGMLATFTVAGAAGATAPPATVGTITMRDFAFGIHVPAHWNGNGVLEVPNVGKEIHELTFVPMKSRAEAAKWTAVLSKGYPQGAPPAGIVFALGGTSPGRTAWVDVHLKPGLYLVICLFPDPKTEKPHTALGMLATLKVVAS
jgi:hypothetical protein